MNTQAQPSKNATRLMQMKEKIEGAKTNKAKKEGERDSILKTLSETFGCNDKGQVERKMKHIDGKIEKKEAEFADEVNKIDKDFPWED